MQVPSSNARSKGAGQEASRGTPSKTPSMERAWLGKRTPSRSPGRTSWPAAPAPRSYKRLQEDLVEAEAIIECSEAQEKEACNESRSLRQALLAAEAQTHFVAASEGALRAELQRLRGEAADIWGVHEAPLRGQDAAIRSSAEVRSALERSTSRKARSLTILRAECRELAELEGTLRREAAEARRGHAELALRAESNQERQRQLELRCSEGEGVVMELQRAAAGQHGSAARAEAEANAQQLEARAAQVELAEQEWQLQEQVRRLHVDGRMAQQALAVQAQALRAELQRGELELEAQARESAAWRERAFRRESALCALVGEDVAAGLRALQEQCKRQASDEGAGQGAAAR